MPTDYTTVHFNPIVRLGDLHYNFITMAFRDLVIHSQLIPPYPRKAVIARPRIRLLLQQALRSPLTLLLAGTGYGKSTALSELRSGSYPLFWYSVNEPDRDPLLFLVHLIAAFARHEEDYGRDALRFLEENNGRAVPAALTPLINTLTSHMLADALLVIDDYHWVHDVPEIAALLRQLIQYCPPRLHIVLSTRSMPDNLDLNRWRIKGEMTVLTHTELAFNAEEIEQLFNEGYGFSITRKQAQRMAEETEGWALALQMIWQSLQRGMTHSLDEVLEKLPVNLEGLFDYLAPEVLARQPQEMQRFLLRTSILRQLEADVCNVLVGASSSAAILRRLYDGGMFIEAAGDQVYRYQRLFQEFLQAQLIQQGGNPHALHRRAAQVFVQQGRSEEAIFHLLEAEEFDYAADILEQIGMDMIRSGRLESLQRWLNRLPEAMRTSRPLLQLLLGDILRLRADFDAALEQFSRAERLYLASGDRWGRSRALRGQAQVYLDTIRPLQADALLEEALRLLEPQEYRQEVAALLDQLAENKLNLGHPDQAQVLHREARLLRAEIHPNDVYLEGRSLLRTGRLNEARQLLLAQAEEERRSEAQRAQRFHRETLLLLSLICSMLGNGEEAERFAREGVEIGRRLQSVFVEAVGFIRLGHALQINNPQPWAAAQRQEAIRLCQRAIEQMHPFKVARVGVEPLWGLCRAFGLDGDLVAAERCATNALEISEKAGDEWIGNLVRTSMGAVLVRANQREAAAAWLKRAAQGFESVGDYYSWTASQLWLALNDWQSGDATAALIGFSAVLEMVAQHEYDSLLTRPTLLGLVDEQAVVPLLLAARQQGICPPVVERLLRQLRVEGEYHPGYTLYVRTLGAFGVWRGVTPVSSGDWQREKARQLFQLLVTHRRQWLLRDQIIDQLWPDLDAEAAVRDFKVALNALNRALEPDRPRAAAPFFIQRLDNSYGINPLARVVVDADEFESLVSAEDVSEHTLRRALGVYEADYLPDTCYADWSSAERERLRHLYLATVSRLASLLREERRWDEVIALSNTVLMRDNTWEPGYRLIMEAYADKGNLPQVLNAYQRCENILREELGVEPSAETRSLLRRLMA